LEGRSGLNNFTKGILVGVGVGLLVAPLSGKETRDLLRRRFNEWRDSLPEDSLVNQYMAQVSDKMSQAKGNLQGYAQQAVNKVKDTGNAWSDKAQQYAGQAVDKVKDTSSTLGNKAWQTGQDVANRAKQVVRSGGDTSTSLNETPETNNNFIHQR
jgi:gas vesicle protein